VVDDEVDAADTAGSTASTTTSRLLRVAPLPRPQRLLLPQLRLLPPRRHPLLVSSSKRNSRHAAVEVVVVDDEVDVTDTAGNTASTVTTSKLPVVLTPLPPHPLRLPLLPQLRPHPLRHLPLVNSTMSSSLSSANISRNSRHAEVEVAVVADEVDDVDMAGSTANTTTSRVVLRLPALLHPQRPHPQLRPRLLRHPLPVSSTKKNSRPAEVEVVVVDDEVADTDTAGSTASTATPSRLVLMLVPLLPHPQRPPQLRLPPPKPPLLLPVTKVSSLMPVISSILTRSWKLSCDRFSLDFML